MPMQVWKPHLTLIKADLKDRIYMIWDYLGTNQSLYTIYIATLSCQKEIPKKHEGWLLQLCPLKFKVECSSWLSSIILMSLELYHMPFDIWNKKVYKENGLQRGVFRGKGNDPLLCLLFFVKSFFRWQNGQNSAICHGPEGWLGCEQVTVTL